jgi:hypothetical protein
LAKDRLANLFFFYHSDFIIVYSIIKKEKGSIDSVTKFFPKPQIQIANEWQMRMAQEMGL